DRVAGLAREDLLGGGLRHQCLPAGARAPVAAAPAEAAAPSAGPDAAGLPPGPPAAAPCPRSHNAKMRLVISASSASLARALTRHTASTSTPVLTPMRSSRLATSSVATFPVAPGMNGQPPRPPNAVSKRVTPCLN